MWRSAIMAEVIQERVEDRLPELEQLERTGLFSHAEIKAIIRKALELEYRIQRRSLLKDDFIRYVQVSNFITSESPHKFKISYRIVSLVSVSFELLELMVSRKAVFEQE